MKSTQEVAQRLCELCRQGQWGQAQNELFDENAVSIEMEGTPAPKVQGMPAIKAKAEQWDQMVEEVHGGSVGEPIVAGNFFTVPMSMDVTYKERGRHKMEELAVYEVKNGKIVKEQFFYDTNE
ncbi:MAG: nuclear transport factor 2 family protein [Bacteroidia bacterium]|nr:nuclear transport factor 2 family protein [Bacteroidia bacterium]